MYDMVGIVCTANGEQKYIDAVREMWRNIRDDAVEGFRPERVKYDNGTPVIPWKQATNIMLQQMAVMKRVNGG